MGRPHCAATPCGFYSACSLCSQQKWAQAVCVRKHMAAVLQVGQSIWVEPPPTLWRQGGINNDLQSQESPRSSPAFSACLSLVCYAESGLVWKWPLCRLLCWVVQGIQLDTSRHLAPAALVGVAGVVPGLPARCQRGHLLFPLAPLLRDKWLWGM